jgi:hypothetical protein
MVCVYPLQWSCLSTVAHLEDQWRRVCDPVSALRHSRVLGDRRIGHAPAAHRALSEGLGLRRNTGVTVGERNDLGV